MSKLEDVKINRKTDYLINLPNPKVYIPGILTSVNVFPCTEEPAYGSLSIGLIAG
jgi:hypothetical protein